MSESAIDRSVQGPTSAYRWIGRNKQGPGGADSYTYILIPQEARPSEIRV